MAASSAMSVSNIDDGSQPQTVSQTFCDPTADVVFESCDNVLFRVHSKYLIATSPILAGSARISVDAPGEPVRLDESSQILEALFPFIQPPSASLDFRYPSVTNMDSTLLFAMAHAAEKYAVFAAMSSCVLRMHMMTETHALMVLNHAYAYKYKELALLAVNPSMRGIDFQIVAQQLTAPGVLNNWLVHLERYRRVASIGNVWHQTELKRKNTSNCQLFAQKWSLFNRQCAESPSEAHMIDISVTPNLCNNTQCGCTPSRQKGLADLLRQEIAQMPPFYSA